MGNKAREPIKLTFCILSQSYYGPSALALGEDGKVDEIIVTMSDGEGFFREVCIPWYELSGHKQPVPWLKVAADSWLLLGMATQPEESFLKLLSRLSIQCWTGEYPQPQQVAEGLLLIGFKDDTKRTLPDSEKPSMFSRISQIAQRLSTTPEKVAKELLMTGFVTKQELKEILATGFVTKQEVLACRI